MTRRTPEFIRQRILWCAKKNGLPFDNTGYWDEAPTALGQAVPSALLSPVIFSLSDNGEGTVIGVAEVCVISKSGTQRMSLAELRDVTSPCLSEGKQKVEFDAIKLQGANEQSLILPTERGRGYFAIWNILLMLIRLNKRLIQEATNDVSRVAKS